MKLTFQSKFRAQIEHEVVWERVESALEQIEPEFRCYVRLEDPSTGSYIQCAGGPNRLTVELRKFKDEAFKHYVLGHASSGREPSIVWTEILCSSGPIAVHVPEVLTSKDSVVLFKSFYDGSEIPIAYKARNVTKFFTRRS